MPAILALYIVLTARPENNLPNVAEFTVPVSNSDPLSRENSYVQLLAVSTNSEVGGAYLKGRSHYLC